MGYRSDWQMMIVSNHDIDGIMDKLHTLAGEGVNSKDPNIVDAATLLQEMMDFAIIDKSDSHLHMGDDSWKLRDNWDALTATLENEFKLPHYDLAYGRIGEDYNDTEVHHGTYSFLYVNRSLSCDIGEFEELEKPESLDPQPVLKGTCKCLLANILDPSVGHDNDCPEYGVNGSIGQKVR